MPHASSASNHCALCCIAILPHTLGFVRVPPLRRKLLLGEISVAGGEIDWSSATLQQLGQLTPDQNGHLRSLDSALRAEELSALVLGRPDHAVFLSMWACLWSSLPSSGVTLARARKLFDQTDAIETIRAFVIDHGVAPHPLTLVRQLTQQGSAYRRT